MSEDKQLMFDLDIAPAPHELCKLATKVDPDNKPVNYYPQSKMAWLQRMKHKTKRARIKMQRDKWKDIYPDLAKELKYLSNGYTQMSNPKMINVLLLLEWHEDRYLRSKELGDGNVQ